jgi:tRNA threonylcarbamoyl adenosine modification protein (Sua5/YciO/YrdC/YwlC family)
VSGGGPAAGDEAAAFERCMSVGGVAVFPSDTVYGLACDAQNRLAVERLYELKRRSLGKPSAVMFFDLDLALSALPELGPRTRAVLERLLPGPVTTLLPNLSVRFPLACGDDPFTLGLRVPIVPVLAAVRWPVLQSSANLAGGPEARRLDEVPEAIRRRADMLVDGGELPGTASTVVDLRRLETDQEWRVIREGALGADALAAAIDGQFHFHPETYASEIKADIPVYEEFQAAVVAATGAGALRILELGTGTGETTRRLLDRHPQAELVGIDKSPAMLEAGRAELPAQRVTLSVARVQDELPTGRFDLVVSALCVHHLDGEEKQRLFERVRERLGVGGRFVLGDVVVPACAEDAVISLTQGWDKPSPLPDQIRWLQVAGFAVEVSWQHRDLAVVRAVAV